MVLLFRKEFNPKMNSFVAIRWENIETFCIIIAGDIMKKTSVLLILLLMNFLIACQSILPSSTTSQSPSSTTLSTTTEKRAIVISPSLAKQLLDQNPEIILVDVRREEEFLTSRIPGAINAPLGELHYTYSILLPNKQATYVLYCQTGNRSSVAAALLIELGYETIYDMGGIEFWPYDIIS